MWIILELGFAEVTDKSPRISSIPTSTRNAVPLDGEMNTCSIDAPIEACSAIENFALRVPSASPEAHAATSSTRS